MAQQYSLGTAEYWNRAMASSHPAYMEETDPQDLEKKIVEFRRIMQSRCDPLPEEPDYFTSDLILTEFLRARKYKMEKAAIMLTSAVEWRRQYRPLQVDCKYCHENPGFHCIRQIGHDKLGRPLLYACFAQASATKNSSGDTIAHCVQMLENARRSFKKSATQVVFIFDCTGMTLPCCNPKLGKDVMGVFANYFPERLGCAIIINHKTIFQSLWNAVKRFLDPVTAKKMRFLKKDKHIGPGLREICDEPTAKWLEEEIRLNRTITESQMRFWEGPNDADAAHDPRGTMEYVWEFCGATPHPSGYRPHPNIVDMLSRKLAPGFAVKVRSTEGSHKIDKKEKKAYGIESDDEVDEDACDSD